jgi:hypothetical protein
VGAAIVAPKETTMNNKSRQNEVTTGILMLVLFFIPIWAPALLVILFGWWK